MFLRIASSNQHHMYIKSKLENHACNFRPNLWYKFLLLFLSHVLKSQPQAGASFCLGRPDYKKQRR